jgi:phosphoribosylformimino-5-aminoimidazole carboxamide ribotide isomerase
MKMRFRPCIDIHKGKVKQIVGSTLKEGADPVTNFESSLLPSHYASMYREDNLPGGHVIMLGEGNRDAAVDALQAFPGGMHAGGGIHPGNAGLFLDAGASHVIVTSYVFSQGKVNWNHLKEMTATVGKERLVLDLSCRKRDDAYRVVTDRWQCETEVSLNADLFRRLGEYCDEFLIHAAHIEGMRSGIDCALVTLLGGLDSRQITYAGGVRSFEDLELVASAGGGRIDVTIGSALDLFGGELSYRKVVEWFRKRNNGQD